MIFMAFIGMKTDLSKKKKARKNTRKILSTNQGVIEKIY